jgi:Transposase, Mutator family
MGGESEAAWRSLLDDLVLRGLKAPGFVTVDGAPGLEKALGLHGAQASQPVIPRLTDQNRWIQSRKRSDMMVHGVSAAADEMRFRSW